MKIDSREIRDLRPDVAANVLIFIDLMKEKGFPVGISSTYRNDEQQAYLYAQGRTRPGSIITGSRVTTFHGARLAFDMYQNIKGKEWNDASFWKAGDEILEQMGFSRLKGEKCHAQWSENGKYTGSQVRSGMVPRLMPLFKDKIAEYKETILEHCPFSAPDLVWKCVESHPYAKSWLKMWAESYK